MVGWWPGDGSTADISGSANDGVLQNGAAFGPGKVGQAFVLDGVNDYVRVANVPALNFGANTDFTLDAWIKTTEACAGSPGTCAAPHFPILEKRELGGTLKGYLLYLRGTAIDNTGILTLQLNDASGYTLFSSTSSDLRDGAFHHVAVTIDRDNPTGIRFYVDGAPAGVADPTIKGDVDSTHDLYIGHEGLLRDGYSFPGIIDEVEIFERSLSPTEIAGIFNAGSAGKCKPPTIPGISEWGLIALMLTGLATGAVVFGRRDGGRGLEAPDRRISESP